jgi:hypothetical protein
VSGETAAAADGEPRHAATAERADSPAFWQGLAQASADVLGAEWTAGGGCGGLGETSCDYAAHAAAVMGEASAARRRQAAADQARAEEAGRAAAQRSISSAWEADVGLRPSVKAGFLNGGDLNIVRGASGVAMAPHVGGAREARAEAAALAAAAVRRDVAARAQGMAFLMPGGRARAAESGGGGDHPGGKARAGGSETGGGDTGGGAGGGDGRTGVGGGGGSGGLGGGGICDGSLGVCSECSGGDGSGGGEGASSDGWSSNSGGASGGNGDRRCGRGGGGSGCGGICACGGGGSGGSDETGSCVEVAAARADGAAGAPHVAEEEETALQRVALAVARDNPLGHVGSGVTEFNRNQSGMGVVPTSLRVRHK